MERINDCENYDESVAWCYDQFLGRNCIGRFCTFICTRPKGHNGFHAANGGTTVDVKKGDSK